MSEVKHVYRKIYTIERQHEHRPLQVWAGEDGLMYMQEGYSQDKYTKEEAYCVINAIQSVLMELPSSTPTEAE